MPNDPDFSNLTPEEVRLRKREWNRAPLSDLFPRIPNVALERVLDKCSEKGFHYNLSESRIWNARRLTSIVVAHVRHFYSDYDKLLRESFERYEARRRSSEQVLREFSPWDADNECLESCFKATLLPPSERDPTWDPMDIDSDDESDAEEAVAVEDPMDLD